MKSSTTSLFRWLDEHPGTALPPEKEPAYFVADRDPRERRTYRRLLATPEGQLTGEASVAYTRWPDRGAAQRIAVDAPAARLVYVLRDPIERLISHHRHEVQRGRERRPLEDAVEQDPTYVETSRYGAILESWLDAVPARQVLVVDFEKLTGESHDEWHRVLDFLGLDRIDRPPAGHNLSVEKAPFTRLGGRLYGGHLMRRAGRLPRPIRTTLRRLAIRPAGTPSVVGTGADDILRSRLDALPSDDPEPLRRIAPGTYDGSAFAPSWMAT